MLVVVFSILLVFIADGVLVYFNEIAEAKEREAAKDVEKIKAEALRRECRRVRRFLEADGETVNIAAARAYMRKREREAALLPEVVAFEVIE